MSGQAAALIARALMPGEEPRRDETSERVLDAALELAGEFGLAKLTMDEIAQRAGVGRMTLYRRFGDKQQLVDDLSLREARACLRALDAAVPADQPLADQLAGAFVAGLRIAREHPLLGRLARADPRGLLKSLSSEHGALFVLARAFAVDRLRRAGAKTRNPDVLAELFLRLGLSFVLLQESVLPLEDEAALQRLVRGLLAPALNS